MKIRLFLLLLGVGTTIITSTAQENSQNRTMPNRGKTMLSPEQKAKQMTEKMDSLLGLSEKQYKKIYKLNLKEADEQTKNRKEAMPRPDTDREKGAGDKRPPQGAMNEGPRGHRPPGGEGNRPPHKFGETQGEMKTKERSREKRNKKLRKILSKEQYKRWETELHNQRH